MNPSDPHAVKLTTYALGELEAAEAARLEADLRDDPSAREEIRETQALADVLQAALAAESLQGNPSAAGAVSQKAETPPKTKQVRWFRPAVRRLPHLLPMLSVFAVLGLAFALLVPTVGKVRESARRSVDQSNLRQIGQSFLIACNEHPQGKFPDAEDVRHVAMIQATIGGLNDASIWLAGADGVLVRTFGVVLGSDRAIDPTFRSQPLSYAVALPMPESSMPDTTPIAWTRGLRDDGTWAPDSPYGGAGGYIVYLGGNVSFFRSGEVLKGNVRFSDGGKPASWSEVLPPGRRVSEWVPTPEQSRSILRSVQFHEVKETARDWFGPSLAIASGVMLVAALALFALRRHRVGLVLLLLAAGAFVVMLVVMIESRVR